MNAKYLTRVTPENIPDGLKLHTNWAVWTPTPRGNGKIAKRPLTPSSLKAAQVNNPLTWGTFSEALAAISRGEIPLGLEYILDGRHDLVGVDLDDCFTPSGMLKPYAAIIVDRLNTYTEKSPSGRGLRLLCRGFIPENCKGEIIEIYDKHAVTLTGDLYGNAKPIRECPDDIIALLYEYFSNKMRTQRGEGDEAEAEDMPPAFQIGGPYEPEKDDDAIRKLRSNPTRAALWDGDSSMYGGDASRGDAALVWHIIYWSNSTQYADIDRLFRRSGRMRPKWDEIHSADGLTYGQRTIRMVLNSMRGVK